MRRLAALARRSPWWARQQNERRKCLPGAIAAGIDVLGGKNRVQEMTQKLAENAYDGAPLHFIGHPQRNKVKQVVGKAAPIQSVSSPGPAGRD